MQVGFLIAGTQKGGTTALYEYLREHPDLCLSEPKETHFFDTEEHFEPCCVDYTPLHAQFRPRQGQLLGEATPITMYWADAPRRVWEYNPRMKVICILRNPIERAFSHWNMERERGNEVLTFEEAIRREPERCRATLPFQHRIYSYTGRGFYSEQINRLWQFFPRNQTLFLRSEELRYQPQAMLDRVFDFLGVTRQPVVPRVVHARSYLAPMSTTARELLIKTYEREVQAVSQLLDWDCREWLAPIPQGWVDR